MSVILLFIIVVSLSSSIAFQCYEEPLGGNRSNEVLVTVNGTLYGFDACSVSFDRVIERAWWSSGNRHQYCRLGEVKLYTLRLSCISAANISIDESLHVLLIISFRPPTASQVSPSPPQDWGFEWKSYTLLTILLLITGVLCWSCGFGCQRCAARTNTATDREEKDSLL